MIHSKIYSIFQRSSTTYFLSSLFFPKEIKQDVFTLYAFVRTADNFVDQVPQDKKGLAVFYKKYQQSFEGKKSQNIIIDEFVVLEKKYGFTHAWTISFFDSMFQDCEKDTYHTQDELIDYMYGSAEVIGLMMARIMGLQTQADHAAQMLGRAMQFANTIRDIAVDQKLGRTYMPKNEYEQFGLSSMTALSVKKNPEKFAAFIRHQVEVYDSWQADAEQGFQYIPKRLLIPIKTASDMYVWTMNSIRHNPQLVFTTQLKPKKRQVVYAALQNMLLLYGSHKHLRGTSLE